MSTQEDEKQDVGYETPPMCDLLTLLLKNRRPSGACNEVWSNIYISDAATAREKTLLQSFGISHIINAAHGPHHIDTGADFYSNTNIQYYGVEASDNRNFDMTPFFYPTAAFIHDALNQQHGKVLVHCARGVSRSAALVLAYLMIHQRLTLSEAINIVSARRNILPNAGFLQQLCQLDSTLALDRKPTPEVHSYFWLKMTSQGKTEASEEEYFTPNGYELEKHLTHGSVAYTHVNEVWPNVYIGNEETARDRHKLKSLGITHILNAAEGEWNSVDTGPEYYKDMNVDYYGITAEDTTIFNLSQYFCTTAEYIHQTLVNPQNKMLIHCVMGRSRSATLFLAYLMIHENMTVVNAIDHVKSRRRIIPNWGFLKQLRELDISLLEQRRAQNTQQTQDM
ncbi:uncharacterized protein LOC130438690 [Triplophysa dalaica]|uniref:uncharacterized protein LOC130438690 n=1 Tax=Triplophysa dalaica TaxID=1582913 RepID=UPI0024DFE2BE|nr:uncharacterized protein LOC130438690 [Triplophysa dalaica]